MPGTCIDIISFFVGISAINVCINFAILILPLPMIWTLDIERHHKLALSAVFMLGGLVVIASIIRAVVLSQIEIVDVTWEFVNVALWTAAEPSIAVMSASLPILRSLWIWNRRKRSGRSGADSPASEKERPPPPAYQQSVLPRSRSRHGGPGRGVFGKAPSVESQKFPLTDLPVGAQHVYGNRVTVASYGRSRKLSDDTDDFASLPIMHPQEAAMAYRYAQQQQEQQGHGESSRSMNFGLHSNRSELYG